MSVNGHEDCLPSAAPYGGVDAVGASWETGRARGNAVPLRRARSGGSMFKQWAGPSPSTSTGDVVKLCGGPCVVHDGVRLDVPEGSKRLLVLVALSSGRVDRRKAAGQLWPDGDDARASGNLRSALWRLKGAGIDVLGPDGTMLRLRGGTVVDVDVLSAWALRMADDTVTDRELRMVD